MNNKTIKTYRYELEDGFFVDVSESVEYNRLFDFYLFHEDYGIKDWMFSIECKKDEFENLILNDKDEYIEFYKKEYCDYEVD